MQTTTKAIVRLMHGRIVVLCHLGHYIECHAADSSMAGSAFSAELSAHNNGTSYHRFDRLSAACSGHGH